MILNSVSKCVKTRITLIDIFLLKIDYHKVSLIFHIRDFRFGAKVSEMVPNGINPGLFKSDFSAF